MPARMGLLHRGVTVDDPIGGLSLLLLISLCACQTSAIEQAYPSRPLSFIAPWEAGASGDVASHILAGALEKELGRAVNVINQGGSNGILGHAALAQSEADGYTLGVLTEAITMMRWVGMTHIDFGSYSPIALIAVNPPVITVRRDAPWKTVHDLVTVLEATPGTVTASGSRFGGLWDLSRIGFLEALDLEESALAWQPSQGTAPALRDLLTNSVHVVFSPVSEVDSLRRAGKVRILATMADKRLAPVPEIPALNELGIDYHSSGTWFALAAPKKLPDARLELLRVAVWNISRQTEFRESMENAGFHLQYLAGDALVSFLREEDLSNGLLLTKGGYALE